MTFETIHNFYERLVLKTIEMCHLTDEERNNVDFLEDVACCALNRLPSKYVRYDVDLMFYMTAKEREHIEALTYSAVMKALDYVRSHSRDREQAASYKKKHSNKK